MPAGRPTNHDAKIARLINELRKALVAREMAKIDVAVGVHVDALVRGLAKSEGGSDATMDPLPVAKKSGRKGRSAASRALQARKMKAYWAKKKEAKAGTDGKKARAGK